MTRKDSRAPRRDSETSARPRKGGGLFAGLVVGLVIGLVLSAGLAWYFNLGSGSFKPVDSNLPADKTTAVNEKPAKSHPDEAIKAEASRPEPATPETPPPAHAEATEKKSPPADTPAPAAKPRVDYTFYGILPGDKPAKPIEHPKSRETWWLQVAALKNPGDADKLKARLALLGLQVSTEKVESADQFLYRVRVGPYKREDDALGDLDTLAQNNFEPRLLKEPVKP
jgi:cell division protein FtsN